MRVVEITNEAGYAQATGKIVDDQGVRLPGLAPGAYLARAAAPGAQITAADPTAGPPSPEAAAELAGKSFLEREVHVHEIRRARHGRRLDFDLLREIVVAADGGLVVPLPARC